MQRLLIIIGMLAANGLLGFVANIAANQATGGGPIRLLAWSISAVVTFAISVLVTRVLNQRIEDIPRAAQDFWLAVRGRFRRRGGAPRPHLPLAPLFAAIAAVYVLTTIAFLVTVVWLNGRADHCQGTQVKLRIAASQEKDGVLREIAKGYNGRQVGDTCAQVEVVSINSGTMMRTLARGWKESADGERPDVWSPASSVWLTLLREQSHTPDGTTPVPAGPAQPIAVTPLVIAMPEPMATALGWPDKELGWADLAKLSRDKRGWAAYGHPEWGAFKLGKTNPGYSTSGLEATIGAYYAKLGGVSDMTVDDVKKPEVHAFVQDVERSIVHYGDIALTFLENLQRADQKGTATAYISAVTVEESHVVNYNRGNPNGNPADLGKRPPPHTRLVSIYPKEGTLYSDHPYIPLTWMSPTKKAVADDFLKYLHSPQGQSQLQTLGGFRDVKGRPGAIHTRAMGVLPDKVITKLNLPAPEVIDAVLKSWEQLRKRANVLIVIDKSGSMKTRVEGTGSTRLELAKSAALNALAQFRGDDQVGLWLFSSEENGALDYRQVVPPGPMTGVQPKLREEIGKIEPHGNTGLYDTTAAAFDQMRGARLPDAINAVVFLTDGKNEKTKPGIDLTHLLQRLDQSPGESVRIFTIGYGEEADQQVLQQIADITEGHAYDSRDPRVIDEVFASVISNF